MSEDRQALMDAVGWAAQAYQRSADALDDAVAAHLGLNRTDLRCLDWLADGPKSAGQLAEATGLSTAATTTLLDRLEGRGLVRRVRDTADRRRVLVELTGAGQRLTAECYGPLVEEGGRLLERYSESELALLRDFLGAIRELNDRQRARLRRSRSEPEPQR
jgi:DNA-binding MarR family transcriptional regulator